MATVTLNLTSFRDRFKAFNNVVTYTDATIQTTWDTSIIYVSDVTNNCFTATKLELALQQMTAHLLTVSDKLTTSKKSMGTVTSSSIDKVSVTLAAPKNSDEWEFWLNQTPYGQQLLALLNTVCVGGFYFGGDGPRLGYL
jgi:hypothetical protein